MDNDYTIRHEAPTRRDYVKYGGAVVGGGLLAGCSGINDTDSTPDPTQTTTETATETTAADESYSVTMSPMGTVEFESVPETAMSWNGYVADFLVALGQQDRMTAFNTPDSYYHGFYDELPGVAFDTSDVTALFDGELLVDKEMLYQLDCDIHHLDPVAWQRNIFDAADIKEIEQNIGPFFNNAFSRANSYEGDQPYEFYTLWEILGKFEQVYQVEGRSDRLKQVRDELVESIQAELPPQEERPWVALTTYEGDSEGTFTVYLLNSPGFGRAHTRPLGANDPVDEAGIEFSAAYTEIDMEGMLELDPGVMIGTYGWKSPDEQHMKDFLALGDHPVGKEITAVQNDRLYLGGDDRQGPIGNLFQLEFTAKQIYPDIFGEPPEPRGSVPEDEQLFDRQRVADIINGDV